MNQRPISDYRLTHALIGAYETLLDSGSYPCAALFLEIEPEQVDVNVHPRKAEVRFAESGRVYGAVRSAIRAALASHLPPTRIVARPVAGRPARSDAAIDGMGDGHSYDRETSRHAALPLRDWVVSEGTVPAPGEARAQVAWSTETPAPEKPGIDAGQISGTEGAIQPLAQYANTYILAADGRGLLIIDQHVAHERILYERVLEQLTARGVEAQHLLVPETLELDAGEAAVLEEQSGLLAELGFEVEPFGGSSWAIRTAPAVLEGRRLSATLRDLLESMGSGTGDEAMQKARQQAAATIACHAAVRANHPLSREEMVSLVADLSACEAPTRCPHGRPVLLRVDHDELERRLGRR